MKKSLKYAAILPVLGALILAGGCQSMNSKDDAVCPSCDKKVMSFHPQKGHQYKKVACPSCKSVTVVDSSTGTSTVTHACDDCGTLVGQCPKCASK